MTNINNLNKSHYDSEDNRINEIIIKRLSNSMWEITAKTEYEAEGVKSLNYINTANRFSLDFSNYADVLIPSEIGFDYKNLLFEI